MSSSDLSWDIGHSIHVPSISWGLILQYSCKIPLDVLHDVI